MKLIEGVVYEDVEIEDLESAKMTEWILKLRGIGKKKNKYRLHRKIICFS